jgi:putative heme iron utilization protein
MGHRTVFSAVIGTTLLLAAHGAAADTAVCATPEQAKQVQAHYAANPGMPFRAAPALKLNEAVIASALPKEHAAGTGPANFAQVWEAMKGMEGTFLVMKGGNVFEIHDKVPVGEASTRSKFFNLKGEGDGMAGHLRPDLLSAIYALAIPGKEKDQMTRAVIFVDGASGESAFAFVVSGEGPPPSAETVTQYDKLMAAVKALPAICK